MMTTSSFQRIPRSFWIWRRQIVSGICYCWSCDIWPSGTVIITLGKSRICGISTVGISGVCLVSGWIIRRVRSFVWDNGFFMRSRNSFWICWVLIILRISPLLVPGRIISTLIVIPAFAFVLPYPIRPWSWQISGFAFSSTAFGRHLWLRNRIWVPLQLAPAKVCISITGFTALLCSLPAEENCLPAEPHSLINAISQNGLILSEVDTIPTEKWCSAIALNRPNRRRKFVTGPSIWLGPLNQEMTVVLRVATRKPKQLFIGHSRQRVEHFVQSYPWGRGLNTCRF